MYKIWRPGARAALRWIGASGADDRFWVGVCRINCHQFRILPRRQFFIDVVSRKKRVGSALFRTMGRPAG